MVAVVVLVESGAAVAKRMEQSPKRGRRVPLRGRAATNDQLARAAAMLKNEINRSSRSLTSVVPAYTAGLQPLSWHRTPPRDRAALVTSTPTAPRRGLLKNIYAANELVEAATAKEFLAVQTEGQRRVQRRILHYNREKHPNRFRLRNTEAAQEELPKRHLQFQKIDERPHVRQISRHAATVSAQEPRCWIC